MSRYSRSKKEPVTNASKIEEYSIERLLRVGKAEDTCIVQNLLRKGDQMLLAGPPKTGKSYLASELALALSLPFSAEEKERTLWCASVPKPATEPKHRIPPRFVINPKPEPRDKLPGARGWNVLVFTLEMNVSEVARRLLHQAAKYVPGVKQLEKDEPLDGLLQEAELTHIFALPGKKGEQVQDLSILDATVARFGSPPEFMPGQHSVGLKKAIQDHKPDVIIYDSLIQLHNLSENDNVQMKAVMRELRRISSYQKEGRTESVAHIILHHTRKPSAKEARDPSAAMMRGAGSIHAAADLVSHAGIQHVSLRHLPIPSSRPGTGQLPADERPLNVGYGNYSRRRPKRGAGFPHRCRGPRNHQIRFSAPAPQHVGNW
jgi:hypothetical protein